jgi:hypothetical protein
MTFGIILAGFIAGIMIGISGIGGGSLITPMLIFVFNIPPLIAVGTDLLLGSITKFVGAYQHYKLGNVNSNITKILLSGSIPGAISGIIFLKLFPIAQLGSIDRFIKHLLGVILLLVALGLIYPVVWKKVEQIRSAQSEKTQIYIVRIFSYIVGFLVALTSVGSGSLFVPFLLAFYSLPLNRVVGIDVFHGAILSLVASSGHLISGNIDFFLLLNLLVGSISGVILGAKLSVIFPKRVVQLILAFMLTISGLKLL